MRETAKINVKNEVKIILAVLQLGANAIHV
jgi:hypothetical protein